MLLVADASQSFTPAHGAAHFLSYMRKLLILLLSLLPLGAAAQRDTVVTRLREVAVVGVKQTPESELAPATVVRAPEIERLGIVTIKGVSELAPNFFMPDYGSRMTSSIYVRGLGARIDQPVVGLNVDGVIYLNKDNYDFDLADIERIEVLRGAQSILNGRNTMGGQINIVTLSPWRFQGWRAMAEYGRANSVKASVGWYGRLSSPLATAITGYFTSTDGYHRNAYNGARVDTERHGSARWKLSYHPSERLSITNTASFSLTRQGGLPYRNLASGLIAYDDTAYYRRTSVADGLVVGWTGKRVVVNSVTSFQYIDDDLTADQDFLPLPYFTLTQARREWALTQDLYTRGSRGSYRWLGGVFGFYKHASMRAPVTFKDTGIAQLIEKHPNEMNPFYPIAWDEREFLLGSHFTPITRGVALYMQHELELGNWLLEAGLRWDMESATLIYDSHCASGYTQWHVLPDGQREVYQHVPVNIDDHGHLSQSFNELLPKLAAGYSFSRHSRLYASVAKGYKAGGYNSQMFSDVLQQRVMEVLGLTMKYDPAQIVSYKPEKSWNFELGAELSTPSENLRAKLNLFFISCLDQQLTTFPPGLTTGRIMTNAGRTRSMGAEATVAYTPVQQLKLNASYGYTDATFRRYNNGRADFRGKHVPYAPAHTLVLAAAYDLPWHPCGLQPAAEASLRAAGKIYWDEANTLSQPFYATVGVALSLTAPKWSVRLWGENITNTRYDTFYFMSMGNQFMQQGRPWSVGATVRLNLPK